MAMIRYGSNEVAKTPKFVVPKHHQMDPKTETLLESGELLRSGMTVLIADPADREERFDALDRDVKGEALLTNRWVTIADLRWDGGRYEPYSSVVFNEVCEDGTKIRRRAAVYRKWYVKIESTPEYKRQRAVFELVKTALMTRPLSSEAETNKYAMDLSERIADLFE